MEEDDYTVAVDGGGRRRTLTSKEVFTWANTNNQRLPTSAILIEQASMASYNVEVFMRVNLLLLNEQMWEARSK
uniref:Uncharacterized protein n=1 Tax=Oryza nivara TaxID=4536 RepID=A0A0E0J0X2_ORYNI